jgi:hypothetical protein
MAFTGTMLPVDWQDATYTIIWLGHTTVTETDLRANSHDDVTVQAPAQIGAYQLTCQFNGTALFAPASYNMPITVSEKLPISVRLFTNPTTLTIGHPITMDVTISGVSGVPAPSGSFYIFIGSSMTYPITIGPNGKTLVEFGPQYGINGPQTITVFYPGNPYYDRADATFPLTNPPIPGDSGGSGSGGASGATGAPGTGTATPRTTASPTGGAATLTALPTPARPVPTPPPSRVGVSGALALVVGLGATLPLVLVGGMLWLARRRGWPVGGRGRAVRDGEATSRQPTLAVNDQTSPSGSDGGFPSGQANG